MKLKNILIVVKDIEKSKWFYQKLFGLRVLTDFGENVILSEGLVLQEQKTWESFVKKEVIYGNHDAELYFEENDMDSFLEKLKSYSGEICYVNEFMEHEWGQRVVRIYDPDNHVIEIGEPMESVVRRFINNGMSVEETAERTQLPIEYIKKLENYE